MTTSETTKVFAPGTQVCVHTDIVGLVVAVRLSGKPVMIQYLVAWWSGRTRHEEWLFESEVSERPHHDCPTLRIGFACART